MKNRKLLLHGEIKVVLNATIPSNAQRVALTPALLIVGHSESGNHHILDIDLTTAEGCEFYVLDGVRYMRSTVDVPLRCTDPGRHHTDVLPPGTYEFGTQQEYDPFAARLRNVAD